MEIGETQLLGSDVPSSSFHSMRGVYLSLTVNSSDEAERLFALSDKGADLHADGGERC